MRIAIVFPCALMRLHRSSEVSFTGAMAESERKERRLRKEETQSSGRVNESSLHTESALPSGPDSTPSPSKNRHHGKLTHSLALGYMGLESSTRIQTNRVMP